MPTSTYLANALLNHQVGKTAYTMPTAYVALSSTTPTAAGTGVTEPAGGGYARVATTGATWAAASAGSIANSAAISFPAASADWVAGANLTYGVLYDAATGGNMLGFGLLTTPKNILNGDTATLAAGGITITLS